MTGIITRAATWGVVLGLCLGGTGVPTAVAQLATQDPALGAGVEALIAADPEVRGNPALAQLCRDVAEATVHDPGVRAEVIREARVVMPRDGIDPQQVVTPEVRQAARTEFARMQERMREEARRLHDSDPDAARGIEFQLEEAGRQLRALERRERYVPSEAMVRHANEAFERWQQDAWTRGMPEEMLALARADFVRWTPGGIGGATPGERATWSRGVTEEEMEAVGLTPEQIAALGTGWNRDGSVLSPADLTRRGLTADQQRRLGEFSRTGPGAPGDPSRTGPMSERPQGWHYNERGQLYVMTPTGDHPWTAEMGPLPAGLDPQWGGGPASHGWVESPRAPVTTDTFGGLGLSQDQVAAIVSVTEGQRREGMTGGFIGRDRMRELGLTQEQIYRVESAAGYPSGPGGSEHTTAWEGQRDWSQVPPPGDPATWSPEQRTAYYHDPAAGSTTYDRGMATQGGGWESSGSSGMTGSGETWTRTSESAWVPSGDGTWTRTDTTSGYHTYDSGYNPNYDTAQEGNHGCAGLTAEQKAAHQAHGHCPNE